MQLQFFGDCGGWRDGEPVGEAGPDAAPEGVPQPVPTASSREPERSDLRLCVLGTGSGGNSTIVEAGGRSLLIDVGLGPRTIATRLEQAGTSLDAVSDVLLTHLDQDHFRPSWPKHLAARGIRVHLHRWHVGELLGMKDAALLEEHDLIRTVDESEPFELTPGLSARSIRLQHDLQGTTGYRLDMGRSAIGYATDLGHVPAELIELFAGVDLLCLECNYDEHMTINSPRPSYVNRRNLSDSGHLSNEQSFAAARAISERSPGGRPRHVVLMHRSRQCNHPMKVLRVFERDPSLAGRVVMGEQRRRTRWLAAKPLPEVRRAQTGFGSL